MKTHTMQRTNKMHAAMIVALAALAHNAAQAAEPGFYLGTNVGASRAKIDDGRVASGLLGSGLVMTSIDDDNRDIGFKLFGGYQFNRYLSVEGGFFEMGKFGFSANTLPNGRLDGTLRLRGVNADLVGTLPVTDRFSIFGRVGANYAQVRDSFNGSGAVVVTTPSVRKYGTHVKVGAGVEYAFTDALAMRAEYERYRINDGLRNKGDVDFVSVGLLYRFGAKTPTRAPVVAVAAPIAVAPAPVVVPPPPPPAPPKPGKVTLSADALFDFDRATIKREGTASLERAAAELRGAQVDRVTVVGHTDRLGPRAHNLALSARRAESVKAYLVSSGVPADRIVTNGVDGANPVTAPDQCKGSRATPKLIACLQPDRRVEIEFVVTK